MEKSKSSKKLVIALVVIIIAIVAVGIVFFMGGKSDSAPSDPAEAKKAVDQVVSENSALESNEYKAAIEYNEYFDTLSDEETDKLMENNANAIYDAPDQVKKLCEKYNLKYSEKATELTSWTEVEKAVKDKSFTEIFSEDLMSALKTSADQYGGGYSLDQGNLYLEMEAEKDGATALITMDITPEGVFPWQDSMFAVAKGDESGKIVFTYKTGNDDPFSCVIDGWEGTAFGKAGGYYISIVVSNQSSSETDDAEKLTQSDMESYLDQIDFTKFM